MVFNLLTVIILLKATNIAGWPFYWISCFDLFMIYRMYTNHFNKRMANLRELSKETGDDFANNLESAYSNAIDNNGYTCPAECLPEESPTLVQVLQQLMVKKDILEQIVTEMYG